MNSTQRRKSIWNGQTCLNVIKICGFNDVMFEMCTLDHLLGKIMAAINHVAEQDAWYEKQQCTHFWKTNGKHTSTVVSWCFYSFKIYSNIQQFNVSLRAL